MLPHWIYLLAILPVAVLLGALAIRHFAKMYSPDSWRRWLVARRESGRLSRVLALLTPALYLLFIAVFLAPFGGSTLIRILSQLPMACMFAAMQTLSLARRPSGEHLRCSKCGYALDGLEAGPVTGPNGRHDGRCPECGGQWGWPGGTVRGTKRWSAKWIAVSVVLLLPLLVQFGSVPVMGVLWWNGAILRLAPTSSLVEEVLTQKSFTMHAWAELSRRTETGAQTSRIATRLLRRPTGTYFSSDEAAWLSRSLRARRIDRLLVEPHLRELFTLTARTPATSDRALVELKPEPRAFDPVEGTVVPPAAFEVVAVLRSEGQGAGDASLAPVAVTTQGLPLFRSYSVGPLAMAGGGMDRRFRGMLSVSLRVPGSPMVEALYSVEIPVDVSVLEQK